MEFSTDLSSSAQAAYSDLLHVVRYDDLSRTIANLSGSFSKKTQGGKTYWYYQATDVLSGGVRQHFVGPDNKQVRSLVAEAGKKDMKQVARLAAAAVALGCAPTPPVHFRIIRRLNETGVFRAGCVLVGSHAFLSYGNVFGVHWHDTTYTKDIDFAHAGRAVALALPQNLKLDTGKNIEALESGFLPIAGFFPGEKTASFRSKTDKELRIDFLSPMVGGKEQPYLHDALGVHLQPLRFLELILEDVQQAAIISSAGATLANVPDPARYALHKLLVHVERRKRDPEKAKKDLSQAAALLEVLWRDREDDLKEIWASVLAKGPGWRERAAKGLAALAKIAPADPAVLALSAAPKQ